MGDNSHTGTGDAPQNQNNAMSDDPGDGQRKSFAAEKQGSGTGPDAPETQGKERIDQLGRQGSKQD